MRATLLLIQVIVFSLFTPVVVLAVDSDGDGVDDSIDVCCNTPAGVGVDATGRPRGDLDGDCDVDMTDLTVFKSCASRAGVPYTSGCGRADFDMDGDVDMDDFGLIQRSLTGSMSCANELCDGVGPDCRCVADPGTITCGVGACQNTVPACQGGEPNTCTPLPATAETCNHIDDDCDGVVDNGFDLSSDPNNCGGCGIVCSGLHATRSCTAGVCTPLCDFGWMHCDDNTTSGCEAHRDTNPGCGTFTDLGSVQGDSGSDVVSSSGFGEQWFRVTIRDGPTTFGVLSARIRLTPPAGTNFDLLVYCSTCGGSPVATSTNAGSAVETLLYQHTDSLLTNDSRTLIIEVVYTSGQSCENYYLEVAGNTGSGTFTCP